MGIKTTVINHYKNHSGSVHSAVSGTVDDVCFAEAYGYLVSTTLGVSVDDGYCEPKAPGKMLWLASPEVVAMYLLTHKGSKVQVTYSHKDKDLSLDDDYCSLTIDKGFFFQDSESIPWENFISACVVSP